MRRWVSRLASRRCAGLYPLGMLRYLVARRNLESVRIHGRRRVRGRQCADPCVLGGGPIASFASMTTLLPRKPVLGQPTGFLKLPSNLNLGWFVRFVAEPSIVPDPSLPARGL